MRRIGKETRPFGWRKSTSIQALLLCFGAPPASPREKTQEPQPRACPLPHRLSLAPLLPRNRNRPRPLRRPPKPPVGSCTTRQRAGDLLKAGASSVGGR